MSDNIAGSKAAQTNPPEPADNTLILTWARRLVKWLRRSRVVPGYGLEGTQLEGGYVVSSIADPMIGQIILHAGTLIGRSREKWLECDGSVYNVSDYPQLFASIADTWGGNGTTTFAVPPAGVFPVFAGQSPNYARDEIEYTLGDTGGYNLHGKTENNHPDHSVLIDLDHVHDVPFDSAEICAESPVGGVCGTGSPTTIPVYTATQETGDPDGWGTGDQVPATGAPDAEQGSISKTDNDLTITLKHRGHVNKGTNDGGIDDDVDNRPTFAAFKAYIRALP